MFCATRQSLSQVYCVYHPCDTISIVNAHKVSEEQSKLVGIVVFFPLLLSPLKPEDETGEMFELFWGII